jgi:hypothetical protein
MAEATIMSGCWSGADETHATLTELGEKRISVWNFNGHTFGMEELSVY